MRKKGISFSLQGNCFSNTLHSEMMAKGIKKKAQRCCVRADGFRFFSVLLTFVGMNDISATYLIRHIKSVFNYTVLHVFLLWYNLIISNQSDASLVLQCLEHKICSSHSSLSVIVPFRCGVDAGLLNCNSVIHVMNLVSFCFSISPTQTSAPGPEEVCPVAAQLPQHYTRQSGRHRQPEHWPGHCSLLIPLVALLFSPVLFYSGLVPTQAQDGGLPHLPLPQR